MCEVRARGVRTLPACRQSTPLPGVRNVRKEGVASWLTISKRPSHPLPSKRRCRFSKSSKTAITERSFRRGKALTDHIIGQVAAGQTDEQRLVVSGLAHLKSLQRMAEAGKL